MSTGKRFRTFLDNIRLTDKQKTDGSDSRENVVSTLNRYYYGSSSGTSNSQYIGSWAKRTRIRPPRDVDIIFTLPESVYTRYQSRSGNKQSQILQEVKGVLADKFYSTSIKGSGPVVIIPFSAYAVEVAPAFLLTTGQHYICMTEGGGHYKAAAYAAEAEHIATSNQSTNKQHARSYSHDEAVASLLLRFYQVVSHRAYGCGVYLVVGPQRADYSLLRLNGARLPGVPSGTGKRHRLRPWHLRSYESWISVAVEG